MKRQHPENPELFWCPKCRGYFKKSAFSICKARQHGIETYCKKCCSARKVDWRLSSPEGKKAQSVKHYKKFKKKILERTGLNSRRNRENLNDIYVKTALNRSGVTITPETIELKRQQLTMIRTLKQFKQWRKENESNCEVISGEQRKNDPVNAVT